MDHVNRSFRFVGLSNSADHTRARNLGAPRQNSSVRNLRSSSKVGNEKRRTTMGQSLYSLKGSEI